MKKHFSLDAGKTLKLKNIRKLSLVCHEGTLWITNPGDQQDYIVERGETLNLEVKSRRSSIVIGSVHGHGELVVISA